MQEAQAALQEQKQALKAAVPLDPQVARIRRAKPALGAACGARRCCPWLPEPHTGWGEGPQWNEAWAERSLNEA